SREGELTRRLSGAGVEYFLVKMDMWRKVRTWPRLPLTLYRLFRKSHKEKVVLIHCNTLWDTPYGVALGRLLKVPVVTHIRNTFEQEKIKKYWLDKVSLVITVSEAVAWPLKGVGLSHRVIYNGVDLEVFDRKRVSGQQIRRELGLEGALVILLPGRVDTTKGQREAIQAMERVVKRVPQAVLVIVGETSRQEAGLMEDLNTLAREAGVEERVIFTGAREDMPSLMASSDLVIMPSLESAKEGFGRVLIEAMAMGKATVATRTGGIPEVVEDGVTGILVSPGDVEALSEATVRLLKGQETRERMGEMGYKRVKELFDLNRTVAQMEEVYGELIEP
ncbi:MAG: hypothetical protein DRI92_03035, partial [Aquificota bacterium]